MHAPLRAALAVVVLVAGAAAAQPVDEATRSAARDLGYEGVELFDKGDYTAALDRLARAYAVLRVPTLGVWEARALVRLGRLVEASERYAEVSRLQLAPNAAPVQRTAQAEAETERAALLPRIPGVVIEVAGASAQEVEVTVDGARVPAALIGVRRPLDPGKHRVEGRRGSETVGVDVTVAEGALEQATLRFAAPGARAPAGAMAPAAAPAPPPASPPPATPAANADAGAGSTGRSLGWVALGVGSALLVGGVVTGAMALGEKSDLDAGCRDHVCPPELHDRTDRYQSLRMLSTVGFVGGVIGIGGGVTLLATSPARKSEARVRPWLGFGVVGARGRF